MKWTSLLSTVLAGSLAFGTVACGGGEKDDKPKKEKKKKKDPEAGGKTAENGGDTGDTGDTGDSGDSAGGYQVVAVTDKGSIKGTVKWTGADAALAALPISKDTDTCGNEKKTPRLLVDAGTKGVANSVVYLENITKGADLTPKDGTLDQKTCEYGPHIQIVSKGSKLTVINSDPILHNVHAYLGSESLFNTAMPTQGQKFDKELKKPGIMTLKCDAGHTWMSGFIFVTDHPYYAMTDAQGNFTIENVPPGKYTVKMWHEGWDANVSGSAITYNDPIVDSKEVEVAKDGTAEVSFELPKK
jgi:plastocyanin